MPALIKTDYKIRIFCCHKCFSDWNTGKNHVKYINGIRKRKDGYLRYSDDRYVHRVIMEEHLGRKLESSEHIHHIDGNPQNNDINNLQIMTNSEHRQLEYKIAPKNKKGQFICKK